MFLVLAATPRLAAQQTGVITGTVTNVQTGAPVQDATVSIESTTFSRQVTTDSAGKYVVPDVPVGTYHIVIRVNLFLPNRSDVTVKAGEQTSNVALTPELHLQ